jgi:hypothetical protein
MPTGPTPGCCWTRWLAACLQLTFQDEFAGAGLDYLGQNQNLLFNVFLHGLPGPLERPS